MNNLSLYNSLCSLGNLTLAWRKARKGKTKKHYVIKFEKDIEKNLLQLHKELTSKTYKPKPLATFILRDPKTRKISKADFRDRVIHHAIVNTLEPIFDKSFIYDSCANQINKGNLFALKRFDRHKRKISRSHKSHGFCLKADIKHYFQEVDQEILFKILSRKVKLFSQEELRYNRLMESFQGWQAYTKWANTFKLRKSIMKEIAKIRHKKLVAKNQKL